MTPAEELWQAVVKHCNPAEYYRIAVSGSRLTLTNDKAIRYAIYVEPDATGSWIVVDGYDIIANRWHADECVRIAVERICQ